MTKSSINSSPRFMIAVVAKSNTHSPILKKPYQSITPNTRARGGGNFPV